MPLDLKVNIRCIRCVPGQLDLKVLLGANWTIKVNSR